MNEQQMGYERLGFMFERTGSKRTFERFLGEIAAVAEERPFFMLEVMSNFLDARSKQNLWQTVQIREALQQRYGAPAIPTRGPANLSLFLTKPPEVLQLHQCPRIGAGGSSSNDRWVVLIRGHSTQPAATETIGAFSSKLRRERIAPGSKMLHSVE